MKRAHIEQHEHEVDRIYSGLLELMGNWIRDPRVEDMRKKMADNESKLSELHEAVVGIMETQRRVVTTDRQPSKGQDTRPSIEDLRNIVAGKAHLKGCGPGIRKCYCKRLLSTLMADKDEDGEQDEEEERPRRVYSSKMLPPPPTTFSREEVMDACMKIGVIVRMNLYDDSFPHIDRLVKRLPQLNASISCVLRTETCDRRLCSACITHIKDGTCVAANSCDECRFHPVCAGVLITCYGREAFDECYGKIRGGEICSQT